MEVTGLGEAMLLCNDAGIDAAIDFGRDIAIVGLPLAALPACAVGLNSQAASLGGFLRAILSNPLEFKPNALAQSSATSCPLKLRKMI